MFLKYKLRRTYKLQYKLFKRENFGIIMSGYAISIPTTCKEIDVRFNLVSWIKFGYQHLKILKYDTPMLQSTS